MTFKVDFFSETLMAFVNLIKNNTYLLNIIRTLYFLGDRLRKMCAIKNYPLLNTLCYV
jgi:hypothetical protein